MYALDATTGEERWSSTTDATPDDASTPNVTAPVALADGTVLVATEDGLLAFDADDGSQRWTYDGDTRTVGTADGLVFVGENFDYNADVVALNPADGSEQWLFDTHRGTPYFLDDSHALTPPRRGRRSRLRRQRRPAGVRPRRGDRRRADPVRDVRSSCRCSAVESNTVYVANGAYLYSFGATR
ncbi:outer membrane protein assembly factor BamB family protein [Haladaptatus halobius]|uniref:outer membrane protein assembly factor BamB family protein n=1 Tax=Haladaptatus halobius TaxID=2884875 RepID=UPI003F63E63F